MAQGDIKGITIVIDGDTRKLTDSLKTVTKESVKLSNELKTVENALKMNPGNATLIKQQQELLGKQIGATAEKLGQLKEAQSQVDQQFAEGKITPEAYRDFQREVIATQGALDGLKGKMASLEAEQEKVKASTKQLDTLFEATGSSVDDYTDTLGTKLVNAIKNGTASSKQLDDALNKIGTEALGAGTDLEKMKKSLAEVDNGGSIDKVKNDLNALSKESKDAEQSVDGLGDAVQGVVGALMTGGGLAGVIEKSLDVSTLDTKIDVTFDVPPNSVKSVKDAVGLVKAYGVDADAALEGVRRQWALNKDASDEANKAVIKSAGMIASAYSDVDFTELIQETNEIGKSLGISDQEALGLTDSLFRIGFPPDQLDIIAEYCAQLKRAGYNAEEIQGIFAAGIDTGTFNIDGLLDGLKEGRIRLAELGQGLTTSLRDNLKAYTNDAKGMNDEELANYSSSLDSQESKLEESLSSRYDSISDSYDKQKEQLQKSLDAEYEAVSDNYSKQEEQMQTSQDKKYDTLVESYDKQKTALDKSLDKEYAAFEKASEKKIALIDKEYTEKLKLVDEEKYKQIKAIESQIGNLNALTDAEDKAAKAKENADKRNELKSKVLSAKTAEARATALADLANFDEKLRLEKIQEDRKAQIETLRGEKEAVNESADVKKEAIKGEYDKKKKSTEDSLKAKGESLKEEQLLEKEALDTRIADNLEKVRESNQSELKAFQEMNKSKLDDLKDNQDQQKEALDTRLENELESVKANNDAQLESFRQMNDKKLALAKEPPDSAAFKAMESQIVGWGKAIAKGGEDGQKALKEVATWLNTIEDETLKNAIGTEIFGTTWENEGQNIIDTILNAEDAAFKLNEGIIGIGENTKKMDASPAVKLQQAFTDIKTALEPLLTAIANVVASLATWASNNPYITSTIVAIASAIGIIGGAVLTLQPILGLFTGFWPKLIGLFAKIGPIIATITSSLPTLGAVFTALTGPIGLTIAAIAALIAIAVLVVKNWEPIKDFFVNLWNGIVEVFTSVGKTILDFVTDNWLYILGAITGPIGLILAFVIEHWDSISKKTSEVFNKVSTFLTDTWNTIRDNVTGKVSEILTSIKEKFGEIHSVITGKISKAKEKVLTTIRELKTAMGTKFEEVRTAVANVLKKIKTAITEPIGQAKGTILTTIGNLKDSFGTKFEEIRSATSSAWRNIKSAITGPIERARDAVRDAIEKIKGFFQFDLNWPKLKKLKINVEGSLNPLTWYDEGLPKLDLDWYKKGGVFGKPSVIGVGEEPGVSEAVLPLKDSVLSKIGDQIAKTMKPQEGSLNTEILNALSTIAEQLAKLNQPQQQPETAFAGVTVQQLVVREESDINKIAIKLNDLNKRNRRGRGD